jgi:hypothetical protein
MRYNDEKDREKFGFEEVSEYFCGREYKYVTGVIRLNRLYELRDELPGMDVFFACTGKGGENNFNYIV